jgi:hypothetical protein
MTIEPTDEQRRTVKAMSGFGVPQPDIAIHLGVDPKTLRKHFREELDRGAIEATTKVAQSLFNMATQGNNVAAGIFWMKARAGWRETVKTENEHYDRDLQSATADELARELDEIRRRKRTSAREGAVAAGVPAKLPGVLH